MPAHRFSSDDVAISGCKHCFRLAVNDHSVLDRSEILMSGISATASVRRRFAKKTDYVIIYGSVSLAQVRQTVQIEQGNESVRIARLARGHDGLHVV